MARWRGGLLTVSLLANAVMGMQLYGQLSQASATAPLAASTPRRARAPASQPLRLPDRSEPAGRQLAAVQAPTPSLADPGAGAAEPTTRKRAEGSASAGDAAGAEPAQSAGGRAEREGGRRRSRDPLERFDETRLRKMGLGEREIGRFKAHVDALKAESQRAQDDALRAGASRAAGARLQRLAMQRAWAELRKNFGSDVYDTLLYATHQGNRAQVREIVTGSPAANAGFRKGDVILYYDRERVFGPGDITAISRGKNGRETVLVEVQRGTDLLELYVPRGKMGVRLESRSMPPTRF